MASSIENNTDIKNYDLAGKTLVASPSLDGTEFEKALIYIVSNNQDGSLGVIYNKPIGNVDFSELLGSSATVDRSEAFEKMLLPIHYGGPLYKDSFFVLSMNEAQDENFDIKQELTLESDFELFEKAEDISENWPIDNSKKKFIISQGLASWDRGQLENEIGENSWLLVKSDKNSIFSNRIKNKWLNVVKSIGLSEERFKTIVGYGGSA